MTIHDDPRHAPGDSGTDALRRCGEEVLALLQLYVDESRAGSVPVLRQRPLPELAEALDLDRWIRAGGMDDAALGAFLSAYLAETTRLHHPGYIGHQVAVPHYPAALGDLVHGMLNNGMAVYEMGAPATAIEVAVVDWMLAKVGWRSADERYGARVPGRAVPADAGRGPRAGGVLVHGGSLANLTALLAARARSVPDAWDRGVPRDLAVLAPASAHYSIGRAVSIMGLGQEALFGIPVDDCGRVRADRLDEAYEEAVGSGRLIIAVVANAVSTPAGVHDPLPAIADFCEEHALWLHVDGAHGASALLSPALRGRLAGIERADSIVWDAHKLLRTSALCAAALFRDERTIDGAFRQDATCLLEGEQELGVDLIRRTVECTRTSLGLKLFLNLAVEGEAGLARHVETLVGRAAELAALIRGRSGFETLCPGTRPSGASWCAAATSTSRRPTWAGAAG
jgi:L-2,4-diaminobutyrate decarboxylase